MSSAAVQNNMADAIVLKKTEFDQIEAVKAALWLSIESAQQARWQRLLQATTSKRDTKGL
jgi:hypothetical protein